MPVCLPGTMQGWATGLLLLLGGTTALHLLIGVHAWGLSTLGT